MNEQQIHAVLHRAASGAVLPEKFRSVGPLVLNPEPPTQRRAWWHRTLPRTAAVAALVLLTMVGLALTQPGQRVLAGALRQLGWISIDSRSLEQRMGDFRNAKAPPPVPEELERARWVDPAEVAGVLRQYGFVAPLPEGKAALKEERASRPLRLERDGQYRIDKEILTYGQIYRLPTGQEIAVGQQFIAPPENGSFYMMSAETRETKILGHPAYVATRHIGWDEAGKTVITEFPSVRLFLQVDGGARWLELSFRPYGTSGNQASLEEVLRFAEAFTAHAAESLAGQ